ncbi:Chromo (CHRromatin Organization MOdifier) domain [Carpediemonas membranifera]|uniref:Chromo (CHRromatin Organization MOdifier) domain n=1 Tax=Carpediemonas membranifera TaxID=201153 RepID=A0A8J6BDJ3_9EUKA|nr:Chromo (CHRromatin Organization MOdifier) domain [Carpediemonas membranifera]|eukprot:KAG9395247.1 Chromo (CHRromatin Organization MOdifier) domain [Carpediemonas membranifera]
MHDAARAKIAAYERHKASQTQPADNFDWKLERLVLLRYPHKAPSKILPPVRDPLQLLREGKSPNTFVLRDLVTKSELLVHQDRLIRFDPGTADLKTLERIAAYEQDEQQVSAIVGHRERNRRLELLVHWEGLEDSEDSYIPYNAYYDRLAALDDYLRLNPGLTPLFARYKRKFRGNGRR